MPYAQDKQRKNTLDARRYRKKLQASISLRQCPRCGVMHKRITQSYCIPCNNAYQRERRKTKPLDKDKQRARDKARWAHLEPSPCEVCGALDVEMHHDNYAKPLAVRWLCKRHHRALHMRQ